MKNLEQLRALCSNQQQSIEILPRNAENAELVLSELQISTKSMLGTVVSHTGGILAHHGWLRILGSGHEQFQSSILDWNELKHGQATKIPALDWEILQMTYSEFVYWVINGDIDQFYETFRWRNWEEDVKKLHGNQGILIYPFL